jgi:hypothetical protein
MFQVPLRVCVQAFIIDVLCRMRWLSCQIIRSRWCACVRVSQFWLVTHRVVQRSSFADFLPMNDPLLLARFIVKLAARAAVVSVGMRARALV